MKKKLFISFFLASFILTLSTAQKTYHIPQSKVNQVAAKYGTKAEKRVLLWDKLIKNAEQKDILHKLKDVNDFFNKIRYRTDPKHWKKRDYWATPFEFLGTGAGDCEDYAIAKYYTLRKLGIPESKLRIVYVKLKTRRTKFEEAHMVLTYYHKPDATPIVLDNVNKKLKLASKRPDLRPIYSFNAAGLWQAKNRGKTQKRVGKNNLKNWKSLMSRI